MAQEGRRAPKVYDATLKHLVEARPADWLTYLGLATGTQVGAVDADVSSVSAAADKVLRVDGPEHGCVLKPPMPTHGKSGRQLSS
jgi:hypothetical protein